MIRTHFSRGGVWWAPAGLVLLSLVPAIAGTARLAELGGQPHITAANARFVAMPLPVVLHILAAVPFSLFGAFMFSSALHRRYPRRHRQAGRVLVVCGLLAAGSGVWMTLVYPWANNDGEAVYAMRLLFGGWMIVSLVAAMDAIRRRNFARHGEWMMRGYAIGVGAGTQVFTHLPWFILVGAPGETGRAVMMGAGWILNLAVAEWLILSRRDRSPRTPRPATPPMGRERPGVQHA